MLNRNEIVFTGRPHVSEQTPVVLLQYSHQLSVATFATVISLS